MVPAMTRIRHRRREARDVWTLDLDPPEGFPGFAPGQFNMLYVMGVGEIPISFSGDPARRGITHTIRAVGAVSGALAGLKRGAALGLRGPFGSAWPLEAATGKDVVVMAGGIGLAPLRSLLYRLFAAPERYGRITVLYGARSPEDILYARQLESWRARTNARIATIVDHATAGWDGPVGVVTALLTPGLFDPRNAVAFLCGPEVMMRFSTARLMDLGLPAEAIHISMERNMKCAVGHCGHCQFGRHFICKDGPVFRYDRMLKLLSIREL